MPEYSKWEVLRMEDAWKGVKTEFTKKRSKRSYYERNKELCALRSKLQYVQKQLQIKELMKGRECVICGEDNEVCLRFRHPNNISILRLIRMKGGKEKVLEELKKCVVLCVNCQTKVEAGVLLIESGGPQEAIYVAVQHGLTCR